MKSVLSCIVVIILIAMVSIKVHASNDVCDLVSKTFELSKASYILGEVSHAEMVDDFKNIEANSLIHSEFEGAAYSIPDVAFSSIKEYEKPFRSVFLTGKNIDIKIYLDGPTAYDDILEIARATNDRLYRKIKRQSLYSLIKEGASNSNAYNCEDGLDYADLSVLAVTTINVPENAYYTYEENHIAFYGKDARQAVVIFRQNKKSKIILLSITGDPTTIFGYLKELAKYPDDQKVSEQNFVSDLSELSPKN